MACRTQAQARAVLMLGTVVLTTPSWEAIAQTATLEEITVTARRREERLQDVPLAVSALSASDLERQSITDVASLATKVPSLVSNAGLTGGRAQPVFAIRGLSQQEGTMLADPSVTLYFNDIPVPRTQGSNLALFDIASVEVLKGPQGTLFGRNTVGGAILVHPQLPKDAFEASLSQMVGNYGALETQAMLNVPLASWVSARVAGQHVENDGWITDIITGKKVNDVDENAVRLSIDIHPSSTWNSLFTGSYSHADDGGTGGEITALPPGVSSGLRAIQAPLLAAQQQRSIYSIASGVPAYEHVEVSTVDNTTKVTLNDHLSLKNIAGYRNVNYEILEDADGSSALILTVNRQDQQHQFSEEFQVIGTHDWVDWIAGAFYFRESGSNAGPTAGLGAGAGTADPGLIEPNTRMAQYAPNYINTSSDATNTSYAVFAQGTFKLDSLVRGLALTVGLRQNWDKREVTILNRGWLTNTAVPPVVPSAFVCRFTVDADNNPATPETRPSLANCALPLEKSFSEPTYNVSLDYHITDSALVYLAHRHGYRTGGYGARATTQAGLQKTFDPEIVNDVELGFKAEWRFADMSLRTNLAAFHSDYKDIQRLLTDPNLVPITTVTTNAGKAKIDGGEFEFAFQPHRLIQLSGFYSYINARFTEFIAPDGTDLSNAPFARAPKNIVSATARFIVPMDETLGEASIAATYYHTDEYVNSDTFDPTAYVQAYQLWNFDMTWESIMGTGAGVTLFVNNAFNEEYLLPFQQISQVDKSETPGAPRTYGVRLKYRFGG